MDAARGPKESVVPVSRRAGAQRPGKVDLVIGRASWAGRLPWPAEDSPSGLWRSPGTRVGLIALRGSNPLSSALKPGCDYKANSLVAPRTTISRRSMRRWVAVLWHASFSCIAAALYFVF